jgi:hypothetical protein
MPVVLGPYPLCPACRVTNGGLISVSHRQVHLRAHGKQACIDRGLAGLLTNLWAVCETRSCCENNGGRAYVVPTAETCDAAVDMVTRLRLHPWVRDGIIYFQVPAFRLDDAETIRRALDQPEVRWRAAGGRFEPVPPPDGSLDP